MEIKSFYNIDTSFCRKGNFEQNWIIFHSSTKGVVSRVSDARFAVKLVVFEVLFESLFSDAEVRKIKTSFCKNRKMNKSNYFSIVIKNFVGTNGLYSKSFTIPNYNRNDTTNVWPVL